jgi:hypothetical protein
MKKLCSVISDCKYYNIEKIYSATLKNITATSENMYCNHEKYVLQHKKNMYCNIENYVL